MTETKTSETTTQLLPDSDSIPLFGYELLREVLLPNLLGKETASILYWAGKDLARKFPLQSFEEMVDFFIKAGWGSLSLKDESKHEMTFELGSSIISERLKRKKDVTFNLEAGFLAQQFELQKDAVTEAYEHYKKRTNTVFITVKWDKKDRLDD
ncbi:YslB family protein [Bacillus dakarensis]|uniref:YslB family protein n=1 Tax=Robertmurraya dakarensis TaxID=1926278 RepID=UPI000981C65F|nr:YslB family protein [Bacillus dakarensis]